MSKTPQDELLEPVAAEMVSFLRNGQINTEFIGNNLEFKGIDRIQDLKSILRIHFVLSESVVNFLKELPRRIRRIKTDSKKKLIRRRGQIRGRINWSRTVIDQKSQNDRAIFICQNPSKNYDVSENLVLKKLLSIIYFVLDSDLEKPLEKNYTWLKGLNDEEDLITFLKNIYRKNVHVNRIKDPEEYQISERDISVAENSRKELYKEAAELFIKYKKLMEGDFEKKELEELLKETLIIPGDAPTLFELYAVFKLLRKIGENFEIRKYVEGNSEIALFEKGETRVLVYHDSKGGINLYERILKLRQKKSEIEYLERFRKATLEYADLVKKLLDEKKFSIYGGRPDFLIKHYERGELKKLVIGEVKYSDRKSKFKEGLKELVDYLYFAREGDDYVLDNLEIEGVLVVDKKSYLDGSKLNENKVISDSLPFKLEIYDTKDLKGFS